MKEKTSIKKIDRYLQWTFVIGLSFMLILRDIGGISISKFIFLGFIVACMAVAGYETLIKMVCFILPLVCGLPGTYIMPAALVLLILKKGRLLAVQLVPVFAALLLELVAAFWYPKADFVIIINYIAFAAMMIYLIHDNKEVDYEKCIDMYLLGTLVLCTVILVVSFQEAPQDWMGLFERGLFRIGSTKEEVEGMKLTLNANSLAYYSLVGVACCLLLLEQKNKMTKILHIAMALVFVVVGFLTVSRSWWLMMFGCLLLYIAGRLKSPKQFLEAALVFAVLAIVAVWYLNENPVLLAGFETRFADNTVESGGGRTELFKEYMEIYFSDIRYILIGMGVTQYSAIAEASNSVHNGIQQIIVCCGLVGFTIYMVVLIAPILKACRGKKIPIEHWLPLLSVVAFTQTIQFLNPTMLMLPYVIGIYALHTGGHKNENVHHNGRH